MSKQNRLVFSFVVCIILSSLFFSVKQTTAASFSCEALQPVLFAENTVPTDQQHIPKASSETTDSQRYSSSAVVVATHPAEWKLYMKEEMQKTIDILYSRVTFISWVLALALAMTGILLGITILRSHKELQHIRDQHKDTVKACDALRAEVAKHQDALKQSQAELSQHQERLKQSQAELEQHQDALKQKQTDLTQLYGQAEATCKSIEETVENHYNRCVEAANDAQKTAGEAKKTLNESQKLLNDCKKDLPVAHSANQESSAIGNMVKEPIFAYFDMQKKEKVPYSYTPLEARTQAEQGNAQAQYELGCRYFYGHEEKQSYYRAVEWLEKAASKGLVAAQLFLAAMLNTGEGVLLNKSQAAKWYRKAAEQGEAEAQFNLAVMLDFGEGVAEDSDEAIEWYYKAAEQGLAEAQFYLALTLYERNETPEDKIEAEEWYRKAAEQGHAKAQYNLAVMLDEGDGIPVNKVEAEQWFRKAAEQGIVGEASMMEE